MEQIKNTQKETSIAKMRQIMSEKKENYGFIALRGREDHKFLDRAQEDVNPNATIRKGVVVAYKKNNKGEMHFTNDEGYFLVDKNSAIFGKITIGQDKKVRVDVLFDAFKAGDVVDLGEKGVISSYNTEETLYYTNKKSFTTFFAHADVRSESKHISDL